jgi:hypothetical protein
MLSAQAGSLMVGPNSDFLDLFTLETNYLLK